ncbi:MAG: DUF2235 domain-containing protein [Calditrichaeota bacterium]|nr:MAG: DUF2235 domain-containing protein [Calditrichota bacterium]
MGKNIILCADGTGNAGGYSPDSNVYKIYKALEIHDEKNEQIKFYDNGVGTSKNKILRAVTAAFGIGFKSNVCDLYAFLARNYEPGDRVYLFGFSRGAATIRAFSGFVSACGLFRNKDSKGNSLSDEVIKSYTKDAFQSYKKIKLNPGRAKKFREHKNSHGVIDIAFLGVWDTVSALGFPEKWDITGIGMWAFNLLFMALDRITDVLFPHRFYNYELAPNVKFACQALAIDDERTSFWPKVWDETGRPADSVEQVWFAGMHSNVGGGYARPGMAYVALYWMMNRAHQKKLKFNSGALKSAYENSHVNGRIYDSRDGFAVFYRYHPREIAKLCKGKIQGPIKIHKSVIDRLQRKTANYAPGHLPDEFAVVDTPEGSPVKMLSPNSAPAWKKNKNSLGFWVLSRKWLYGLALELALLVFGSALYFWKNPPENSVNNSNDWLMGHINDVLFYISPKMFDGLIIYAVQLNPIYFWAFMASVVTLFVLKIWFKRKNIKAGEQLRTLILESTRSN